MICIQNKNISIFCRSNGKGLTISDINRNSRWILDENTLAFGITDEPGQLNPMIPVKCERTAAREMLLTLRAGEAEIDIAFTLSEDYVEARLPIPSDDKIKVVSMPGSFIPEGEDYKILMPVMQGLMWNGQGEPFERYMREGVHEGFSMSMMGYLGTRGGLLAIPETYDDIQWWIGKDHTGRFWLSNLQTASLGKMRYERIIRLYPTHPDIVSIAKKYRHRVMEKGRFKGWDEKIAERPGLERMFGALWCFIGYCQDDINYADECRKLKAWGFDRAFIYPVRFNTYSNDFKMGGQPPINLCSSQVKQIKELGYDVAPWSWINEALDDGSDRIKSIYRKDKSGNIKKNWEMDHQKWYACCTTFLEEYQKKALDETVADLTWDHFDVITCATNGECHALDHPGHWARPLSRSEDRKWIRKLLLTAQSGGRAISSENFNDAYSMEYDIGSVKAWPVYSHRNFWPVPLTMLVYHDSMIHSWWEVHNYNNLHHSGSRAFYDYGGGRPRLMAALDALMGCPPDVFPFGAQYMWTGRGSETFLYKFRFEDPEVQLALKLALPVAKLHRRIGKLEMVHFKILSEDGNVQETAFSDGTRVIANFSTGLRGDIPGTEPLLGESWRVAD